MCAAVLLTAPLASCTKNPKTNVTVADGQQDGPGAVPAGDAETREVARGHIEKIELSASVTGIGDMLDAGSKLLNMWNPPEPGAPPVDLRNFVSVGLIQEGFGPGFLESIDLDGVHALDLGFPHDGQPGVTEADIDLAVAIAAIDPVRAIESMPAAAQPQPLGDNIWQLVEEQIQVFFRAQPGTPSGQLEIALSMEGLDLAHGLPAQVAVGPDQPRIQVAAANIPTEDIDVSDLIPLPPALARTLSSIINEAESVSLDGDFGTDRDLVARLGAKAPFSRLGLDPIGPATQTASALAKALPGDAMVTWLMPWGDPNLLHEMLDKRIPVDQIPAPFNGYVGDVIKGAHGLLEAIEGEVLATVYIDKAKFTMVLAAEVSDEDGARGAVRGMFGAAKKAFDDHIALAGSSPDHKYSVSFKQGSKSKGDLFTITIPKNMHDDLEDIPWLVGAKKPKLEIASVVSNGKLIVAIGAGQKTLMSAISRRLAKAPDDGLEGGGGLALARKIAGGCQYCIAVDPVEVGEMVFTALANDQSEPKEVRAAASKAVTTLVKLGIEGEVAFALRLDDAEGMLGFGVPKVLLFADPKHIKAIVGLFESIDEARSKAWADGTANPDSK